MFRELRLAARALRHHKTFTVAVTLALALAIGSTGAIFSLVDGLWLRPLDVPDPGRIAWLFATTPSDDSAGWSFPEYQVMRERAASFEDVAALGRRGVTVVDAAGDTELLLVNVVTTNFFSTLGVSGLHGRLFEPGDEPWLDREPVVVLGHAFWQRKYGGDARAVGRRIDLGRGPGRMSALVIGVLPPTFRELAPDADRDLWMPPSTWSRLTGDEDLRARDFRWFDAIGRLRPRTGPIAASAEASAAAAALAAAFPETNTGRSARVVTDRRYRLEEGGVNAAGLLGLVLLVVAITCVNVANLMVARTADRTREIALRLAIGAERRHVLSHLWAESALLGAIGAVLSVLVAMWVIRLLPALLVPPPGFRAFTIFAADARMIGFTLAVTIVTTLLFSLAPVWAVSRADVASLLRSGPIPATRAGVLGRFGRAMVVAQVAVSMVLVSSAAVLGRSFSATRTADLGFGRTPVMTAWIAPADVPPALGATAIEKLRALPGADDVAVAIRAPLSLSGGGMAQSVSVPGRESGAGREAGGDAVQDVKYNAVSANYFEVMGTRLIEGRAFSADDDSGAPVAIVNERFAAAFFPGRSAVGQLIRVGGRTAPDRRIVGVVQNSVIGSIGEPVQPYVYMPFWARSGGELTFLISARDRMPAGFAGEVSRTLKSIAPGLEPRRTIAMSQYVDYSAASYQATAALALALAAIGLIMTSLGVYGVIAYRAARRAKEIGIRLALGAARGQVLRMVLADGLRVGALGLAIGVPAALAATSLLQSLLFGVDPWDASAFVAGAAVLAAAVTLATLLPALRASRIAPSQALREG